MIKLGQLLLKAKVISDAQLSTALAEQEKWGGKLGQILVRMGYLSEDLLTKALAKQLGIPRVDLDRSQPGPLALRKLKVGLAEDYGVLPLEVRDEGKTLVVAMADPRNVRALDELQATTGCRIEAYIAGETEIRTQIARAYAAQEIREESGGDDFKIVDAQGNTVMKKIEDIVAEAPRAAPPPPPVAEPPPPPVAESGPMLGQSPVELLEQVERTQRKEVLVLKALVELLIERGVFSREEYLAKVSRR